MFYRNGCIVGLISDSETQGVTIDGLFAIAFAPVRNIGMDAAKIQPPHAARIHTVELLEQSLDAARAAGYQIREDMLGGRAGAACVIRGKKWLFIDPTAPPRERLEQVVATLRIDPATAGVPLTDALRRVLEFHRAG